MEAVLITKNHPSSCIKAASLISSLLCKASNPDLKDIHAYSEKLKDYLECLTNPKVARMLFILSLLKISTSNELRALLHLRSRDSVVYYFMKAENVGLLTTMKGKEKEYPAIHSFWRKNVPNTHTKTRIFLPTKELFNSIKLYQNFMNSLLSKEEIKTFTDRGKRFTNYMTNEKERIIEDSKAREALAQNTIGACTKCTLILTIEDEQKNRIRSYQGKPYCKPCYMELINDGTVSKHYKNVRTNNRTNK